MRIALIKTSSMGDVIHALPVVTDIVRARPDAVVDWVVEEAFADLPGLHPSVAGVHRVALRRWRRTPLAAATRAEIAAARQRLGAEPYDLVLDLQGLVKSAWVARWARGPRAGFSFACVRERLAAFTYDRRYGVDMTLHAIERLRQLAGQACGIPVEGLPVFGLQAGGPRPEGLPEGPYAVLLHATSRAEKQWPRADWQALCRALAEQRLTPVLPWGSEAERDEACAIAGTASPEASTRRDAFAPWVPPRMPLGRCAAMLRDAACVVGVDTGLTHLACALDRPTVALFAATPAWRFGPYWTPRAVGLGSPGRWPSPGEVLDALEQARAA